MYRLDNHHSVEIDLKGPSVLQVQGLPSQEGLSDVVGTENHHSFVVLRRKSTLPMFMLDTLFCIDP